MKAKTIAQVLALVVFTLTAGTAIAGYKLTPQPLQLFESGGAGLAVGSLAGVRGGGSSTDDIGCWLENDPGGSSTGGCRVTKGNITRSCRFDDNLEYRLPVVSAMTAQSQIYFAWDAAGFCNFLQITEDSAFGLKPL
jgi:hypothetical protein